MNVRFGLFLIALAAPNAASADLSCGSPDESEQCRDAFVRANLPTPHFPDHKNPDEQALYDRIQTQIKIGSELDKQIFSLEIQINQEDAHERRNSISKEIKTRDELGPIIRQPEEEESRLQSLLADQRKLRELEQRKYQTYNDAIQTTIKLYRLTPRVTEGIEHPDLALGTHLKPWEPKYSENEVIAYDPFTGLKHGRRSTADESERYYERLNIPIRRDSNGHVLSPHCGDTNVKDGGIVLLPGAFTSPNALAALIYHETYHWLDRNGYGREMPPTVAYRSDVLAYETEIEQQRVFQLTPTDVRDLRLLQTKYREWANDPNTGPRWENERVRHPERLYGSNMVSLPGVYDAKPEPIKDASDFSFASSIIRDNDRLLIYA